MELESQYVNANSKTTRCCNLLEDFNHEYLYRPLFIQMVKLTFADDFDIRHQHVISQFENRMHNKTKMSSLMNT